MRFAFYAHEPGRLFASSMIVQVVEQPSPAPTTPQVVFDGRQVSSPAEVYRAFREQRSELRGQLERLESTREDLTQRLQDHQLTGADRKGLEGRIADIDQRISAVDKQIAVADAQVASAAAIPGATIEPPRPPRSGPPEEVFVLGGMFMFVVILPLTIAYARRIWRRGAAVVAALPAELADRFTRLEQAVDAIAVEVERIGEGQRFVARYLTEDSGSRALAAGAAQPIEVKQREQVEQRR